MLLSDSNALQCLALLSNIVDCSAADLIGSMESFSFIESRDSVKVCVASAC